MKSSSFIVYGVAIKGEIPFDPRWNEITTGEVQSLDQDEEIEFDDLTLMYCGGDDVDGLRIIPYGNIENGYKNILCVVDSISSYIVDCEGVCVFNPKELIAPEWGERRLKSFLKKHKLKADSEFGWLLASIIDQ